MAFLPAQRQVDVPWQDYAMAPDVALIAVDPQVTTVIVPAGGAQVARGSVIADIDGVRQATLFFPPGVTATLEYSGGVKQALSTLHVRATEYTVGPTGPAAMPGDLPSNSGYTYATEFSVDEVAANGAKDVAFSQPVIDYNENFLGFPIGISVPTGYYDRDTGLWLPSTNGRVIKLLSITSGKADLDVDGSNTAASPAALAALGIGDPERAQLALLYAPGVSLWRTPVTHFSPWDKNWGFGPPPLADGPNLPDPGGGGPGRGKGKGGKGPDDCNCEPKLGDQSDNQTAGDSTAGPDEAGAGGSSGGVGGGGRGGSAGVAGSPFGLKYESDRVPGRLEANTIQIPLSLSTVPAPLKRIDLEVLIAGRTITQSFPAQINQNTTFLWDGKDAYGRTLQGRQPATVRIGYVYDGVYQVVPKFGYNGNGIPISGSKTRREVTLWQEQQTTVGVLDTRGQGLGGWTLDVHHAYDPQGQVLYMGDGQRRSVQAVPNIITALASGFAGDGISLAADGSVFYTTNSFNNNRVYRLDPAGNTTIAAGSGGLCIGANPCGDGGPATAALLAPYSVQVAHDGSLLVVDTARIRKIDLAGIITTVAGTGSAGFSGDGGPARLAKIGSQSQVRGAPDGSIYIADLAANRVRRVSPDGIIDTVAGNGTVCTFGAYPCGDGGPATQATFVGINDLAVAADGVLYIADTADSHGGRVRRVGTDGIISTFAGGGGAVPGNGEKATDVKLKDVHWLAAGPDGSVYEEDQDQVSNTHVRRIGPDGRIAVIAGTGVAGSNGDGGPATAAQISYFLVGIAVGPDGNLYIQDTGNNRMRRVAPPLPAFSASDIAIASVDGQELYQFNSLGRHLRTLNAMTGAVLYTFGYDAGGRQTTVTDGDGNVTTIQHDGGGNPTAIVGPYGQQSALSVDANGYLASLTDPLGHVYQHTYTAGGLLTSSTDPNGHTRTLAYDGLGRLVNDSDAAGGATLFARSDITSTYLVTSTTPLGRTWQFLVANQPDGSLQRTTTDPAGLHFASSASASGQTSVQSPDGMHATLLEGPDPRWGMQSPIPTGISFSTPGGLTLNIQASSAATLADPTQLLSLIAQTDTLSLNGNVYTSAYDAASRTFNETSPVGRQVVTTIDPLGRPVQQQVADLLPAAFGYDARGRLITATVGTGPGARGAAVGYNANGFPSTLTDPLGHSTTFGYDAAGRVLTQTLTDGRIILYAYDAAGNVTSITPPGRPAHTFSYSALDETTVYTPPVALAGTLSTHFAYNADGQLTQVARPDGLSVSVGYDGAGRPATLSLTRGQVGWHYDPTTGQVVTVTAPGGLSLAYRYDGSLPLSEQWLGTITGTVAQGYDNTFRPISQTVNGGASVAYAYDADGLLVQAGALAIDRNLVNGLLISSTLNNVSDGWAYDGFGAPISYSAAYNGTPLLDREYATDVLGRISVLSDTLSGSTAVYSYTYDLAGRLSAVARDGAPYSTYSYDSNSNRLSTTGPSGLITGTYDAQDRLIQYGCISETERRLSLTFWN